MKKSNDIYDNFDQVQLTDEPRHCEQCGSVVDDLDTPEKCEGYDECPYDGNTEDEMKPINFRRRR